MPVRPAHEVRERNTSRGPWLMVLLAAVVGVPSAAVAVLLREGVHRLFHWLEPLRHHPAGILLPAAGALLGVWVVRYLFHEPGGHGVPAVLEAVSRRGGFMRPRSILSRLLGSLVNVASGGSAGLEGPIVFSSAAVGSAVGQRFGLAERQRSLLLACGVAGGIGAIFNAPLTGLIFATEVVLAEWSLTTVVPVAVAATVATELGRLVLGGTGAFHHLGFDFHTVDLAACAVLGALAGVLSVALIRAIRQTEVWSRALSRQRPLAWLGAVGALAGLGVGALGWLEPRAIGEGYETVNDALQGNLEGGASFLLLLLAGKFLATTLTLGTNTPGGIFAPSLVLGAVLGSVFGEVLPRLLPGLSFGEPGLFALVAMAGLVAGTMQAPFTGIFLVLETTGGWALTLPLILVSVLSVMVSRSLQRYSFYTQDLMEEGRLLRPGTDRRILADLVVGEILDAETCSVPAGSNLNDLTQILPSTRRNNFAVVHPETGALEGMLDIASLRPFIFDEALRLATPVDTVMNTEVPCLDFEDSLQTALENFEASGAWVLPVGREGRFVGTISKSTLFDRYRRELIIQTSSRS
ncbi:MAG: chloride channel protein [Planctomycetota bacterium]|nr:MAG: chloride channel protein [Planctomycetota bacterium]